MRFAVILALIVGVAVCTGASAQDYPARPIKLIVPYSAGGPADVVARVIGQRMSAILAQTFIVENRAGAGGSIAGRLVASSDPDGYTLMFGATGPLVISPLVFKLPDYDPSKSLVPVALIGTTSNILVVNPNLPIHSVRELIAYAKANPGKLSYSSPGVGTPPHMIGEMLKLKTGIRMVHVPYKGGGNSTQDVIGGQVQLTFENPAVSLPLARSGSIRALAVTSSVRNPQIPELPTMIEAGFPGFEAILSIGLMAPTGTPPAVIDKIHDDSVKILFQPEVRKRLGEIGMEVIGNSPSEFAVAMKAEAPQWEKVIKNAGIRASD